MIELFCDIETVPCADPDLIALITEGIKPPKTMSKPETIAKWEAEEKPLVISDAVAKTSLDGTYGRVCCITYAFDGEPVQGIIDRREKKVLTQFYEVLHKRCVDIKQGIPQRPVVIGHNITGFDLRFLWQRSIIKGIKPTPLLPWDEKPWGEHIRDTMLMWNTSTEKRIRLHKLCIVLGVESPKDKNGMDGGDVAGLWAKREYDKIIAYGMDDTEAMRQCYRKLCI